MSNVTGQNNNRWKLNIAGSTVNDEIQGDTTVFPDITVTNLSTLNIAVIQSLTAVLGAITTLTSSTISTTTLAVKTINAVSGFVFNGLFNVIGDIQSSADIIAIGNIYGVNGIFSETLNSADLDIGTGSTKTIVTDGNTIHMNNTAFQINPTGSTYDILITALTSIIGVTSIVGATSIDGDLGVTGGMQATGNLIISGLTTLTGLTTMNAAVDINGLLTVSGTSAFDGDVSIVGAFTADGGALLAGEVDVTGSMLVTGILTVTGIFIAPPLLVGAGPNDGVIDITDAVGIRTSLTNLVTPTQVGYLSDLPAHLGTVFAQLAGDNTFSGTNEFDGATNFAYQTTFNAAAVFNDSANFSDPVNFYDSVSVGAGLIANSTLGVNGTSNFHDVMDMVGNKITNLPDGDVTVSGDSCNMGIISYITGQYGPNADAPFRYIPNMQPLSATLFVPTTWASWSVGFGRCGEGTVGGQNTLMGSHCASGTVGNDCCFYGFNCTTIGTRDHTSCYGSNITITGGDATNSSAFGHDAVITKPNQVVLGTSGETVTFPNTAEINAGPFNGVVTGTGTGNATMPFVGSAFKQVIIHLNSLNGTIVYTFPVAFTQTPVIMALPPGGMPTDLTTTTSGTTIIKTTFTGTYILGGF